MLKCEACNNLFSCDETAIRKEERGEYFGEKVYELSVCCPCCGGELSEVKPCALCGTYSFETEESDTICSECFRCLTHDTETILEIGEKNPVDIPINGAIAETLSEKTINKILANYIESKEISLASYVKNDIDYYVSKIKERNIKR